MCNVILTCSYTHGLYNTGRRAALKADSGRNILCHTAESNLFQSAPGFFFVHILYQLNYNPAQNELTILRGGHTLYQLNCNPAQNELTSLRGGQTFCQLNYNPAQNEFSLRGGQTLYQLNCNPAQNELTSLRGGQTLYQLKCNPAQNELTVWEVDTHSTNWTATLPKMNLQVWEVDRHSANWTTTLPKMNLVCEVDRHSTNWTATLPKMNLQVWEVDRHSTNWSATLLKMNLQSERWSGALPTELQPCPKSTYSLRGGQVLYQLNCNPAQNQLTSLRGGQLQGGCNAAGWAVARTLKWTLKKPSQSCPHLSVMPQLPSGTDFRLHNLKHIQRSSVRVEISPTEQTVTLKTW